MCPLPRRAGPAPIKRSVCLSGEHPAGSSCRKLGAHIHDGDDNNADSDDAAPHPAPHAPLALLHNYAKPALFRVALIYDED